MAASERGIRPGGAVGCLALAGVVYLVMAEVEARFPDLVLIFNTFAFWIYFPAVFLLYVSLRHVWQNRMLVAASYVFYASFHPAFLALILTSTVVDYTVGLRIHAATTPRQRRAWLLASLVTNLGLLGFFKYFNFFVESVREGFALVGWQVNPGTLEILLPVGISFYTFQTLSYSLDIYRGRLTPTRDFWDFALFVAYFPQLVAGPIERAARLLPRLQAPRRIRWDDLQVGATLIFFGLFKKICVADVLARTVEVTFASPEQYSSPALLFGAYCFAFQIYADFSGYSDIARGVSRMLGIELMVNFDQPYFARNPTEHWRRWHISLSTWLRDYLYISLGGNRRGRLRVYANVMITFLLSGLWHGAALHFVVWGGLHGVWLSIHRWWRERRPATVRTGRLGFAVRVIATFHVAVLAFVFFRADSLATALRFLEGIVSFESRRALIAAGVNALKISSSEVWLMLATVLVLWIVIDVPQYRRDSHTAILEWRRLPRVAAFSLLGVWLIMTRGSGGGEFIYFQF